MADDGQTELNSVVLFIASGVFLGRGG